jgi:hypothetical protein
MADIPDTNIASLQLQNIAGVWPSSYFLNSYRANGQQAPSAGALF